MSQNLTPQQKTIQQPAPQQQTLQQQSPQQQTLQQLHSYADLLAMIDMQPSLLVFFSSDTCSVCHADLPRVEGLSRRLGILAMRIDVDEVQEAAGQLNVFALPAVILFHSRREYHRQARFIDFTELVEHP